MSNKMNVEGKKKNILNLTKAFIELLMFILLRFELNYWYWGLL